jgi:hypothetical protein
VPLVAFADSEPPLVVPPGVSPGTPSRNASPPISISKLTFSPAAFTVVRDARTRHATKTKTSARRSAHGTTISYVLSGTGTVAVAISKVVAGLRVAGQGCVAARMALLADARGEKRSTPLRHARCKALRRVGVVVHSGKAGRNSFAFTGWLGSRALAAGYYQADATASPAATPPSIVKAAFQIVPAAR